MKYYTYDGVTKIFTGICLSKEKPKNSTTKIPPGDEIYHDIIFDEARDKWQLRLRENEHARWEAELRSRSGNEVKDYEIFNEKIKKFEIDQAKKEEMEAKEQEEKARSELTLEILAQAVLTGNHSVLQEKMETLAVKKQALELIKNPIGKND